MSQNVVSLSLSGEQIEQVLKALDELRAQASVRFAGQGRRKASVADEAV